MNKLSGVKARKIIKNVKERKTERKKESNKDIERGKRRERCLVVKRGKLNEAGLICCKHDLQMKWLFTLFKGLWGKFWKLFFYKFVKGLLINLIKSEKS